MFPHKRKRINDNSKTADEHNFVINNSEDTQSNTFSGNHKKKKKREKIETVKRDSTSFSFSGKCSKEYLVDGLNSEFLFSNHLTAGNEFSVSQPHTDLNEIVYNETVSKLKGKGHKRKDSDETGFTFDSTESNQLTLLPNHSEFKGVSPVNNKMKSKRNKLKNSDFLNDVSFYESKTQLSLCDSGLKNSSNYQEIDESQLITTQPILNTEIVSEFKQKRKKHKKKHLDEMDSVIKTVENHQNNFKRCDEFVSPTLNETKRKRSKFGNLDSTSKDILSHENNKKELLVSNAGLEIPSDIQEVIKKQVFTIEPNFSHETIPEYKHQRKKHKKKYSHETNTILNTAGNYENNSELSDVIFSIEFNKEKRNKLENVSNDLLTQKNYGKTSLDNDSYVEFSSNFQEVSKEQFFAIEHNSSLNTRNISQYKDERKEHKKGDLGETYSILRTAENYEDSKPNGEFDSTNYKKKRKSWKIKNLNDFSSELKIIPNIQEAAKTQLGFEQNSDFSREAMSHKQKKKKHKQGKHNIDENHNFTTESDNSLNIKTISEFKDRRKKHKKDLSDEAAVLNTAENYVDSSKLSDKFVSTSNKKKNRKSELKNFDIVSNDFSMYKIKKNELVCNQQLKIPSNVQETDQTIPFTVDPNSGLNAETMDTHKYKSKKHKKDKYETRDENHSVIYNSTSAYKHIQNKEKSIQNHFNESSLSVQSEMKKYPNNAFKEDFKCEVNSEIYKSHNMDEDSYEAMSTHKHKSKKHKKEKYKDKEENFSFNNNSESTYVHTQNEKNSQNNSNESNLYVQSEMVNYSNSAFAKSDRCKVDTESHKFHCTNMESGKIMTTHKHKNKKHKKDICKEKDENLSIIDNSKSAYKHKRNDEKNIQNNCNESNLFAEFRMVKYSNNAFEENDRCKVNTERYKSNNMDNESYEVMSTHKRKSKRHKKGEYKDKDENISVINNSEPVYKHTKNEKSIQNNFDESILSIQSQMENYSSHAFEKNGSHINTDRHKFPIMDMESYPSNCKKRMAHLSCSINPKYHTEENIQPATAEQNFNFETRPLPKHKRKSHKKVDSDSCVDKTKNNEISMLEYDSKLSSELFSSTHRKKNIKNKHLSDSVSSDILAEKNSSSKVSGNNFTESPVNFQCKETSTNASEQNALKDPVNVCRTNTTKVNKIEQAKSQSNIIDQPYVCNSHQKNNSFSEELNIAANSSQSLDMLNNLTEDPVDFTVPLLHANETVCNFSASQKQELISQGVIMKNGKFTKAEDEIIVKNFNEFTNKYNFSDPFELLGIGKSVRDGNVLKFIKSKHFYVRLAKGLNDRSLRSIYLRARKLLHPHRKEKKSCDSNVSSIKWLQKTIGNKWCRIADILGKDADSCLESYRWHEKDISKGKWTNEEKEQLVKAIQKVTGCSNISFDSVKCISWEQVARYVPTRNFSQCRWYWATYLAWKSESLKSKWNWACYVKLIKILRKEWDVQDASMIDWEKVHKSFVDVSASPAYVQKKWLYLKYKVPGYKSMNYKKILKTLCTIYNITSENK